MYLALNELVCIHHFSSLVPYKGYIAESEQDGLKVKLAGESAEKNFQKGDPMVLGYEQSEQIYICGCSVKYIDRIVGTVELEVDRVDSDAALRQYERFPVSLCADMKIHDSRKKNLATVKDISCYGMRVYAKADIPIGEKVDIGIYMDKNIVFVSAVIVRKQKKTGYFDYGLSIVYDSSTTQNMVREYTKKLKQEQEEGVRKLKKR